MATTLRPPKVYQPGSIARVVEGLRYGDGLGQWSWLAHRLSGVGVLIFLVVHVLDTSMVVFRPDWYDHTVAIYGGVWFNGQYYWPLRWAFRIAELGLIASVVFHSVNGVGVILYDFWDRGTLYRKTILRVVQVIFWATMLVVTPVVLYPLRKAPDATHDIQAEGPIRAEPTHSDLPLAPAPR